MKRTAVRDFLVAGVVLVLGVVAAREATQSRGEFETSQDSVGQVTKKDSKILPVATAIIEQTQYGVQDVGDLEEKKKNVIALVHKGLAVIQKNSFNVALNIINRAIELRHGELYLFVYDLKGTVLAHGENVDFIWQNHYDFKDDFGNYSMRGIIDTALKGGGWYLYRWNRTTKIAYVMPVEKDGQKYVVGCGYYPMSKAEYVIGLVKSAVDTFKRMLEKGYGKETILGLFSYPLGKYRYGDLYLYVLDDKGVTLVHGQRPGIMGENVWNIKDSKGHYFNRDIITRLREKQVGEGIWVDYISKNAPKKAYAERITDKQGNSYYIVSGYHPDANRDAVVDLVKRGATFLSTYGKDEAARKFTRTEMSDVQMTQQFIYGDLYLRVYDMNGVCVAHGDNRELVGRNQLELQDEDGRFLVKEVIQKAKQDGGGWLDFKVNNAFWTLYIERVDVGKESYIVSCGLFPITKRETMTLMVKSAAEYLKAQEDRIVFDFFAKEEGPFVRGDLRIFAFDTWGTCYVWGTDHNLIWQNLYNRLDQEGRPYIKILINTVKMGAGTVSSQENNARKLYYVESVKKDNKTYVVGSGYYP